jgi:hypothetical protein
MWIGPAASGPPGFVGSAAAQWGPLLEGLLLRTFPCILYINSIQQPYRQSVESTYLIDRQQTSVYATSASIDVRVYGKTFAYEVAWHC